MIKVKRPQRWDKPFSEDMTEADVARALSFSPLNKLRGENFNSALPLKGIIANDCRIVHFQPDELVVRKGEYGGSAFLPLKGQVSLVTGDFEDPEPETTSFSFFSKKQHKGLGFSLFERTDDRQHLKISVAFKQYLKQHPKHCLTLDEQSFYGEIAALVRGTRQATLFAQTELEVLEIRWQGLRDLMRYDAELRSHIQNLYKERSLQVQLRNTAFFSHLEADALNQLGQQSLFASYGEFEWQRRFKNVSEESHAKRLQAEPVIVNEGDYADGLLLVCSGFARLSKKINHGEKTIGYLKQGDVFGFEELAHNWRSGEQLPYQHTLRAIGYVDIIRIPTAAVEKYALPHIKDLPVLEKKRDVLDYGLDTGVLEQLVERRFINGTSTMVIDRHRCTGCDDCVNACATLHDGQPRFSRSGAIIDRYAVTHACMHCTDPVCLIGCPTGAIHRNAQRGDIMVDDSTCIGCSACATSCPYDNISMREVFDPKGRVLLDEQSGQPLLKASKCDLCAGHGGIPACEQACPHDALKRLDMGNIASFVEWFNR